MLNETIKALRKSKGLSQQELAVKAGCNPVHFSLDGCPLSCYFSGSVATTSGHFVHKLERRTRNWGFHIRPVC